MAEEYDSYLKTSSGEEWGYNKGEFQDEYIMSSLGGVGTGAMTGAQFGPVGAIVGGALGLFAGLHDANQAKANMLEARERQRELDEEIMGIDVLADFMAASGAVSAKSRTEAKATATEQAARSGLVGGAAADLERMRLADIDTSAMQGIASAVGPATQATAMMREEAMMRHYMQQKLANEALAQPGVLEGFGEVAGLVTQAKALGAFDDWGDQGADFEAAGQSAQGKAYKAGTAEGFTGEGLGSNEMPGPVDLSGGSDTLAGAMGYKQAPPSMHATGDVEEMAGTGGDSWNYQRTMGETGEWKYTTRQGDEGNWVNLPQAAVGEVSGKMDALRPPRPPRPSASTYGTAPSSPSGVVIQDPLMQNLAGNWLQGMQGQGMTYQGSPVGSTSQEWGPGSNLGMYNDEFLRSLGGGF